MVNIQTSKIQRAAVEYANFKVKHDIKDFSNSFGDYINDEGYPTPLGKLIQAIAENAEGTEKVIETMFKTDPMLKDKYTRGFTVDKIEASDYIPAFMQYLKTDKKVAAAVSAMETLLTDADSITEAQIDDISELVSTWEMEGLSLRALMEYTQFNMAVESGADSYTSSFGLGSDGVNNGAAIGKFWGRKNAYIEYWLNGRLHIMDAYMNINKVDEVINKTTEGIEYKASMPAKAVNQPTSNSDVYLLHEIFGGGSAGKQYPQGTRTIEITANEYTPLIVVNAGKTYFRIYKNCF
jgi:hypothetical protein